MSISVDVVGVCRRQVIRYEIDEYAQSVGVRRFDQCLQLQRGAELGTGLEMVGHRITEVIFRRTGDSQMASTPSAAISGKRFRTSS